MEARQQPGVGEQPNVAPHRLQCGVELLGQRLGLEAAVLAHGLQHGQLPGVESHGHGGFCNRSARFTNR